jgi:hypothetical protein
MQSQSANGSGSMASLGSLVPQARKNYGRPFQKLQTVRESNLFIEFPFIWSNHLKFMECTK